MKNCLITQLKGVVDNPNLRPLNAVDFYAISLNNPTEVQQKFQFIFSDTTTVTAIGGRVAESLAGLEDPTATSITFTGTKDLYFSNGNYIVRISDRNHIERLKSQSLNDVNILNCKTSDLLGCENLKYLLMSMISGNTSYLPASLLSTALYSDKINGQLSSFSNPETSQIILNNTSVSGNISDILGLTKISNLFLGDSFNIGGAFDTLLNAIAATGATRTINIQGNGIITLNGTALANNTGAVISVANGSWTVSQ